MSESRHTPHILPLQTYFGVATVLFILTGITVWVAQYDLGEINLEVAMIIAATKASLVALFFMHLKYDNKLYSVIFLTAILFLAAFIIFTMFDTMDRGLVDPEKAMPIDRNAVIYEQNADSIPVVLKDSAAAEAPAASGEAHGE